MSEKREAKYIKLWAAFEQARSERRDALAREMPETPDAFATMDFAAEGEAESRVEHHLRAFAAERKALKKLTKFVRKHSAEVLSPPAVEAPATVEAPSVATPTRKPRLPAAPALAKVRARAKAAVSPVALAAAEPLAAPPSRPRRPRSEPKPSRRGGPGATPKA